MSWEKALFDVTGVERTRLRECGAQGGVSNEGVAWGIGWVLQFRSGSIQVGVFVLGWSL